MEAARIETMVHVFRCGSEAPFIARKQELSYHRYLVCSNLAASVSTLAI